LDAKFWIWIEIFFPLGTANPAGPQDMTDLSYGPQSGALDCGPEPLESSECFDVISFASEFELNSIPTATINLALGRRADDLSTVSAIHYYIDQLQLQLRCRVWCSAKTAAGSAGLDPDTPQWPTEPFLIFEGYVTGSGLQRNQGGAGLILSLTHWLSDLSFSSAISKQSHVLNPAQLYSPAVFSPDPTDVYGAGTDFVIPSSGLTSNYLAIPFFPPLILLDDFWGGVQPTGGSCVDDVSETPSVHATVGGLKDWLLHLTRQDCVNAAQIAAATIGSPAAAYEPALNWQACRALARFEPDAFGPDWSEVGCYYILGVPLALPSFTGLNVNIAISIADSLGAETMQDSVNSTLWDKLLGAYHASYMFSIVPLVEKALCIPWVPSLTNEDGDLAHRILCSGTYESSDLSAAMPRPLRAVGLFTGKKDSTGNDLAQQPVGSYVGFGGYFDKMVASPDPRYKEGLIMFKQAPKWLSLVIWPLYTSASTAIAEANASISTGAGGGAGAAPGGASPATIMSDSTAIWNLYAQYLYSLEILKARQGLITGKVRFDIAPGSIIALEATEDLFVKNILDDNSTACDCTNYTYYYASVLRVSTSIDCQNMRAFTSFYVTHLRNEWENLDPATSISKHPLWQECQWAGCSLIQDPAFAPLVTSACEG
jgi:hypothetical protein